MFTNVRKYGHVFARGTHAHCIYIDEGVIRCGCCGLRAQMAFNPFDNTEKHSTATRKSPFGSRESSPGPDRLTALQHDSPKRGPSPCLPRKTLEELETGTVDPDDPPLSSPWTFWFERCRHRLNHNYKYNSYTE